MQAPPHEVLTADTLRRMYGVEAHITRDTADRPQVQLVRAVE
ncbi:hypothetical protein [Actibacterium ureilyticum]|nr:hypothetical protein [Actibacterium ureilyticum]